MLGEYFCRAVKPEHTGETVSTAIADWSRMDKITNEEVLARTEKTPRFCRLLTPRRTNWMGHNILRHEILRQPLLELFVEGKNTKERLCLKYMEKNSARPILRELPTTKMTGS